MHNPFIMHFPKLLFMALGAATAVFSAVIAPQAQDAVACGSSAEANGRLDKKSPSRDEPFLTSKSHSKYSLSGVLPNKLPD